MYNLIQSMDKCPSVCLLRMKWSIFFAAIQYKGLNFWYILIFCSLCIYSIIYFVCLYMAFCWWEFFYLYWKMSFKLKFNLLMAGYSNLILFVRLINEENKITKDLDEFFNTMRLIKLTGFVWLTWTDDIIDVLVLYAGEAVIRGRGRLPAHLVVHHRVAGRDMGGAPLKNTTNIKYVDLCQE